LTVTFLTATLLASKPQTLSPKRISRSAYLFDGVLSSQCRSVLDLTANFSDRDVAGLGGLHRGGLRPFVQLLLKLPWLHAHQSEASRTVLGLLRDCVWQQPCSAVRGRGHVLPHAPQWTEHGSKFQCRDCPAGQVSARRRVPVLLAVTGPKTLHNAQCPMGITPSGIMPLVASYHFSA